MDEQKFDELLHEMQESYERFPEFAENQSIMEQMKNEKRQPNWKKSFPTLVAVAGLIVFVIMALNFMDTDATIAGNSNSDNEKEVIEEEKGKQSELDNRAEDLETIKFKAEVEEYLEEAKEEFRKNLGVENVDNFQLVKHAEGIVQDIFQNNNELNHRWSDVKNMIDHYFITPQMQVEKLDNRNGNYVNYELLEIYYSLTSFLYSLQTTFVELLNEYQLDESMQEDIVRLQEQPENFNGPQEIAEIMHVVKEQGYLLEKDENQELIIVIDFNRLQNYLKEWDVSEAYISYFEVIKTVEKHVTGMRDPLHDNWRELDSVLLELEELYFTYIDEIDQPLKEEIINNSEYYLQVYLNGGFGGGDPIDEAEQEYRSFLENHTDSIYWSFVNKAVEEYEENDWRLSGNSMDPYGSLRILLSDRFKNSELDDIISLNRWPLHNNTNSTYSQYKKEKDGELLKDLSAFEVMSLFIYAYSRGDSETYYSLFAKDSEWSEMDQETVSDELYNQNYWFDVTQQASHVVTEQIDDNTVYIHFIESWNMEHIIDTLQMTKEDGLWKVNDISID
ncbi:hypothetical protein GMD78_16800 [Ornithinibacillus sp. L9]|uniref:Uncharacterized protein n=1 Tax=Ornithinibacillus caprae TaxID=2678566 RepID=A0A6N8FK50_9BACI|nr:hypothetical protein [Ornithinibacillus caprae]MUK90032.1 hypothetical protein [Ornithinibacillus caprae]